MIRLFDLPHNLSEEKGDRMRGNEKDCICERPNGKHREFCDAYRLAQFEIYIASALFNPTPSIGQGEEIDDGR